MLIYYHIICTPIYCTTSVPCLYLQLVLQRRTHVSGTVYNLVHTVQIIGAGNIHSQVSDNPVIKTIAPSHHRDLQRVNKFWRENFWKFWRESQRKFLENSPLDPWPRRLVQCCSCTRWSQTVPHLQSSIVRSRDPSTTLSTTTTHSVRRACFACLSSLAIYRE